MKHCLALVCRRRLQRVRHGVTKVQQVPFTLFVQVVIDNGALGEGHVFKPTCHLFPVDVFGPRIVVALHPRQGFGVQHGVLDRLGKPSSEFASPQGLHPPGVKVNMLRKVNGAHLIFGTSPVERGFPPHAASTAASGVVGM